MSSTEASTTPSRSAIAIVGMGAIMPEAPDAAAFWNNITRRAATASPTSRRTGGTRICTTTRTRRPRTRPTRASAAGSREFPWDPIAWRLPIPPKVARPDGRRPEVGGRRRPGRRCSTPAGRSWTRRPGAGRGHPRQRDRRREALRDATCASSFPEFDQRARAGRRASPALPADAREAIIAETARDRSRASSPRSPRTRCPASWRTSSPAGSPTCSTSAGPTSPPTPPAPRRWPRSTPPPRGSSTRQFDAAITGGIDRNMGVGAFVKFCKIGALSATGTRPFDAGADGFVMGEGAALFVLKRLADAERDGDRIYAVLLGIGGSSDGKGKGITAPNPVGQRLAIERAWRNAGARPGDRVASRGARHVDARRRRRRAGEPHRGLRRGRRSPPGSIALGSVKSNIGHLKAAAGRRRPVQDGHGAAREGAAAEPELRATRTRTSTGRPRRSG